MCYCRNVHFLWKVICLWTPMKSTQSWEASTSRILRMLKCWDIFITASCLILYQTASMLFFQKSVSRNISERVARLPVTTNRSAKTSFDPWIFSVSRNLTTNVMTNSLKINTYHDFYRAPQKSTPFPKGGEDGFLANYLQVVKWPWWGRKQSIGG